MKTMIPVLFALSCWVTTISMGAEPFSKEIAHEGALAGCRYRVIVSSDIGGTDYDDFQSMVHLFLYADILDFEGLIASPYGPGRREHILAVIDCYEKDYHNLKTYSDRYPTPADLRAITKQGEIERAPYAGVRHSTEGSQWIVECARRNDSRPLYLLVWGGLEDLAQALHDAPDILPKLRVYWIGGPNKKWSPDAYAYIMQNHPNLWIIESNAAYRGWFTGGNQAGPWGNEAFVTQHIQGKGALGDFFVSQKGEIRMGDTPSVGWLLWGHPSDPTQPGWGGAYVRAWDRAYDRYHRMTTPEDKIEIFGILELVLPLGETLPEKPEAVLRVDNQQLAGFAPGDGTMRFRFSPKSKKTFAFTIESNVPALEGQAGGITATLPSPEMVKQPSVGFPNWWTDDPRPDVAERDHHGAKTVSQWREDFLSDFAQRMQRCQVPQVKEVKKPTEQEKAQSALADLNPDLPTLFVASDSTAALGRRPQVGWGECFPSLFNTRQLNVINLARGGRSSRTYVTEGWWQQLLDHSKPGDWVLLQFAHNDDTAIDSKQARGSIPGLGEETVVLMNQLTGKQEEVHTFGWYMRQMIQQAKDAKVNPILVSPTMKNSWHEGQIYRDFERYPAWMKALAEEAEVPFVDLSLLAADALDAMGQTQARSLFRGKTHFLQGGAELHAHLAVVGLDQLKGKPFAAFLSEQGKACLVGASGLDHR